MTSTLQNTPCRLAVVAPVFDDAAAAARLVEQLARAFRSVDAALRIVLVDDGSPVPLVDQLEATTGSAVEVLRLKRNVGHQRAIALGAAYVHEQVPCDALLVLDADGEDRPEDAVHLLARCREIGGGHIVFAERRRRSESAFFRVFYWLYQRLHGALTGVRLRVGNFSVVPAGRLGAVVALPALWNHYAAALFQARLPRELVPTARGTRYCGSSKMNFTGLVTHGMQAVSVFIERVAVRLLLGACLGAVSCGALLALLLAAHGPAWAAWLLGGGLFAALTAALGCFALTLGILAQRSRSEFIPARDYRLFIETLVPMPAKEEGFQPAANRSLFRFSEEPTASQLRHQ